MLNWTKKELNNIGIAEELQIETRRQDGSLRKPVTIWVVRVEDDLYVRSVNGRNGAWFRGALMQHEGQISVRGMDKAVKFEEETDPDINDKIDEAYHAKYSRCPQWVAPMVTSEVRTATIKLVPCLSHV